MELSRKKQIKRRQLPGFDNGLDYINYNYQAQYNPYVGITNSLNNRIDPSIYNQIRDKFNQKSAVNKYTVPLEDKSVNLSPYFALASLVGSGIANGLNAVESADQLITNAGTSVGNSGGFGYTRYNAIDPNHIMHDYDNDTVSSFIRNPIEGIFRLGFRNKQKKQAIEGAILGQGLTRNARAGAQTDALQQNYALAARGKDEGVYTADGIFNMQPNAVGQRDEALMENLDPKHPENASATVIKDGKGGVDDVLLNVKPGTKIGGNDIDWNTGVSFKKEILPLATILEHMKKKYYNNQSNLSSLSKPTQRVQQNEANKVLSGVVKNLKAYTDQQKFQHDITGYNQPMTAERGKDYHTIPNALGALASIGQMIHAGSQEIKPSDSYVPHRYAGKVTDTLAGLNINEQPGLQQINKAARYADYGITHSGGMSGSQKQLNRLANANNMYTNYLKFLWDSQAQRNAYKAQYANALATIGAQEAQNRQNANQWDLDYYSKAHAAKLGGIQMGLRNLMDYANQWSADASKRYQFNKMYGLYAFDTYNNANKYR